MKRALRVTTDFQFEVLDLSTDSYRKLSDSVGGLVEHVGLNSQVSLWCNEEGKLQADPVINAVATFFFHQEYGPSDLICGDVVFTGGDDGNGDNESLSIENAEMIKDVARRLAKAMSLSVTII
jgi:hypothetical protein